MSSSRRRQKNRAKKRKKERERSLRESRKAGCPHPGKRRYHTQDEADSALTATWRKVGRNKYPIRIYECSCGAWHLTKR